MIRTKSKYPEGSLILRNQSVAINKVNWKKVNDSLAQSGLNTSEINSLNTLFGSVVESHTELGELIFIRQYMFSVLIRLHNYLKESNMLKNSENIKDIYDYILTSLILAIEISANFSFDTGISFLITRVMNKIFDIENTNTALVIIDSRFKMKQKFVIEPIITNKSDKISIDKVKDYVNFIFNLFSYCDSATRFVSISVLCSSLWITNFKELPYTIDDQIVPDFSSDPANNEMLYSLLLARRRFILGSFTGEVEDGIDLGDYSLDEFLRDEPEELYEEIKKFEGEGEVESDIDIYDDDEDEDGMDAAGMSDEEQRALLEEFMQYDEDGTLPEPLENEIKLYNNILTDLNVALNGAIPHSNVTDEDAKGKKSGKEYPRIRRLFSHRLMEDVTIKDVITSVNEYEEELKHKKKKKPDHQKALKTLNEVLDEIKKEKEEDDKLTQEIESLPDSYYENLLQGSAYIKEQMEWVKFIDYMQDILAIVAKKKDKITVEDVSKMINGYNNSNTAKKVIFKNMKEIDGSITMDHVKGTRVLDKCTIKDGKIEYKPFTDDNTIKKVIKRRKKEA